MFNGIKNLLVNTSTARTSMSVGWSEPPRRTTDLWLNAFHTSPMLDPVTMIATDISGTPYKLFNKAQYKKDPQNAEPFTEHDIYNLLDNPMPDHPEIDYASLMYLTSIYFEITGEHFWLIDRDARGKPCGVYPIPSNWMLLTPQQNIPYFRVQPMGNTSHKYFNADPKDVVWFKTPNIVNPYGRGRARAEAIGDEIETSEFASKYAKNFFYNDATPPMILEMPGITKEGAEAFKESWVQKLGGFLNARKPAVVAQKDFKVHQLATSQREMDFTESRKYLIQMANEHFCVPPEMRGNLQNSNRATIDSAFFLWTKNVITKRLKLIESTLNKQFMPMFDKTLIWKFDNIVPEDNAFNLTLANQGLAAGTITRNEWRKIATNCGVKLLPDEGRGDVYLTGIMLQETPAFENPSIITVEEPSMPDNTMDNVPDNEPSIDEVEPKANLDAVIKNINDLTDKMNYETVGMKLSKVMEKGFSDEQKKAIWTTFDKSATAHEDSFKKAVRKFAGIQSEKVNSALKNVKTESDAEKALKTVFNNDANIALKRALASSWLASMQTGRENAKAILSKKKAASSDSVTNALFNKWIDLAGYEKSVFINKLAMQESLDSGEGLALMSQKILEASAGAFEAMTTWRAELIARTESTASVNYGSFATYKVEGIEKKEWLFTYDDRTRESHTEISPLVIGIDETWSVGDSELEFPGDPSGSAGETINCRCSISPVVEVE
jgi:HK97 family phage portal protein